MADQNIEKTRSGPGLRLGLGVLLAVMVLLVYAQTARHRFINWDDYTYVSHNPRVLEGLSWEGLKWALQPDARTANWHPLTWVSHMLDIELFGLDEGAHNLVNVSFHLANTLLLFAFLLLAAGRVWPAFFVAAILAVHPLHVESVAWIAERKDVLSGFFFLLTLISYIYYTRRATLARLGVVALLFALALMAKPMAVTLPGVLLLLDYWPLKRLTKPGGGFNARVFWEKTPLFLLSLGSAVITVLAQHAGQAMGTLAHFPIATRLANAAASHARYLGHAFWPSGLAPHYFYKTPVPPWQWGLGLGLLVLISIMAWRFRRQAPWLLTGWLWYLGMLLPVIGIVQVGSQALADRYAYLPLIGVSMAVAYSASELIQRLASRARLAALTANFILLAALTWAGHAQAGFWRDGYALFGRLVKLQPQNFVGHFHLAKNHKLDGRLEQARLHYQEAVRLWPENFAALNNLGNVAYDLGDRRAAKEYFQRALRVNPDYTVALNNLAALYLLADDYLAAARLYARRVRLEPKNAQARYQLALALANAGRFEEAVAQFEATLRLNPDLAGARENLARARRDIQREKSRAPRH